MRKFGLGLLVPLLASGACSSPEDAPPFARGGVLPPQTGAPGVVEGPATGGPGWGDWSSGSLKDVTLEGNMDGMSDAGWDISMERSFGYVSGHEVSVEVHFEQAGNYGMVGAFAYEGGNISEGDTFAFSTFGESTASGIACTGPSPGNWDMDVGAYDGAVEVVGLDMEGDAIISFQMDFGDLGRVSGTAVIGWNESGAGMWGGGGWAGPPPPPPGEVWTADVVAADLAGGRGDHMSSDWGLEEGQWSYLDRYGSDLYLDAYLRSPEGSHANVYVWSYGLEPGDLGGQTLTVGDGQTEAQVCYGASLYDCNDFSWGVDGSLSLQVGVDGEPVSAMLKVVGEDGDVLKGSFEFDRSSGPPVEPYTFF